MTPEHLVIFLLAAVFALLLFRKITSPGPEKADAAPGYINIVMEQVPGGYVAHIPEMNARFFAPTRPEAAQKALAEVLARQ